MCKSVKSYFVYFIILIIEIASNSIRAQNVALGTWTAHLPFLNALSVCQSKDYVYGACEYGVVGVNKDNFLVEKYTKVSGLAEVMVAQVGYDTVSSTLVIAYTNSNIDLIHNGKITNIPYLKNSSNFSNKTINYIYCNNGFAYLATGFGLVKIDLLQNEIKETYIFDNGGSTINVNAVWANDSIIYCATQTGIYSGKIASNINLLNFNNWQQHSIGIPTSSASAITYFQNKIITAIGNTFYQYDGTNWTTFFSEANWITKHLNNSNGNLLIAQQKEVSGNVVDSRLGVWNGSGFTFYDNSPNIERPLQLIQDQNGKLWHADYYKGLVYQDGGNFNAIVPNGPDRISCKEMDYMDGTIWVASSTITSGWNPTGLSAANYFYRCKDYTWQTYNQYQFPVLDTFAQIAVVKTLPQENKVIFGAAGYADGGIIEFNPTDNSFKTIKYAPNVPESFRITGADMDASGNVWFSNTYSGAPLICRKADGSYLFFNSSFLNGKLVKDVLVDDYNQIWIAKEDASGGLVMLNYGNDIDDKSDDQFYNLAAGSGNGNLPVNNVICMAKDADGTIWLGTTQGIAVIACAAYVTDYACEAEQICIDRNDGSGFCDNLLEDEIINCITVDAANRKWIGTNNGIFLVSPDGTETISYFNEDNSPLLSNVIRSITIQPENGDVYIGTDKGICSYRADATETTDATEKPFVYPNPVRENYTGLIAFKGIPNNCNVKIVDVSGNLVYETTANGGQATWDGNLISGERAATGVYYVLCKGSDKKAKAKLKFILMH